MSLSNNNSALVLQAYKFTITYFSRKFHVIATTSSNEWKRDSRSDHNHEAIPEGPNAHHEVGQRETKLQEANGSLVIIVAIEKYWVLAVTLLKRRHQKELWINMFLYYDNKKYDIYCLSLRFFQAVFKENKHIYIGSKVWDWFKKIVQFKLVHKLKILFESHHNENENEIFHILVFLFHWSLMK